MQLLKYDSQMVHEGAYHILLIHILKFVGYFTIEAINIAFSLGTGLAAIRLPLYFLTELVVFFDVFYYLNIADRSHILEGRKHTIRNLILEAVKMTIIVLVGSLLIIYSSVTPIFADGTPSSSVFTILQMHFLLTNMLVFSKISWTQDLSIFKILVLLAQLAIYYIGMLIVAVTSLYEFKGVIYYMFGNKLYFVSIVVVWVLLMVDFGKVVLKLDFTVLKKAFERNRY
jgi:hypothetical protein